MRLNRQVKHDRTMQSFDLVHAGEIVFLGLLFSIFYRIPFFIQNTNNGDLVINALTIVASLFIVILVIPQLVRDKKASTFFGLLLFFCISVTPLSASGGNLLGEAAKYYATVLLQVSYCLLIYAFIKRNNPIWISSIEFVSWCIVLINFYTLIAFPQGLYHVGESTNASSYRNWFLGYDNAHAEFYIYAVMFAMLGSWKRTGKQVSLSSLLMYLICLVSTLMVQASTSTVAMAVLGIYLLLKGRSENAGFFNIKTYLILYIAISVVLISTAIGIPLLPEAITNSVSEALGKEATFSNRTTLWSNALEWFTHSPLFGHGIETSDMLAAKIGHPSGAHNEFINMLYSGGIVHFALFCIILVLSVRPLLKNKELIPSRIISIAILCMLLLQMMRGCSEVYWLSMYLMAYYVVEIDRSIGKSAEQEAQDGS